MRYEKVSRIVSLISVALVASVTFAVAAGAVQTITTPNAFTASYALSPGSSSRAFTPPANIPTFVMGSDQTANEIGFDVGSSDMTVVSTSSSFFGPALTWNGLESNGGGVTSSSSHTPGTHMIFIDELHCVDLEVNSANSFKVRNGCAAGLGTQMGFVTEIW